MMIRDDAAGLRRVFAVALWTGVGLVAAVLAWRSAAGALVEPPPVWGVWSAVGAADLVGLLALWVSRRPSGERDARSAGRAVAATLVPPVVLSLVLSPAGSSAAVAGLTVLFIASAVGAWVIMGAGREPADEAAAGTSAVVGAAPADALRVHPEDRHVVQWMTRRAEAGQDVIEGAVSVQFAAGQRQAAVHLAFCPAFGETPEVECEPLDGAEVEVRLSAAHSYGARVEARRAEAEAEARVEIGFTAAAPLRESEAA